MPNRSLIKQAGNIIARQLGIEDLSSAQGLVSWLGINNLHARYAMNRNWHENTFRWDKLSFDSDDVDLLRNGNECRLYFQNEHIRGGLVYAKPDAGYNHDDLVTTFRCQKSGNYFIHGQFHLNLSFTDHVTDNEGETSYGYLYANVKRLASKTEDTQRLLAMDKGYVIDKRPVSADPNIILQDSLYDLRGGDYFNLQAGDEISLSPVIDLTMYAGLTLSTTYYAGSFAGDFIGNCCKMQNEPYNSVQLIT